MAMTDPDIQIGMTSLKKPGTFCGRPPSIVSSVIVNHNIKVQHRSNIFIQQQRERLDNIQHMLGKLKLQYDVSTSFEQAEINKVCFIRLQRAYQESSLVMQVLLKLNAELLHARRSFKTALHAHEDVSRFRKRIIWLDDRIKKIHQVQSQKYSDALQDLISCRSEMADEEQGITKYNLEANLTTELDAGPEQNFFITMLTDDSTNDEDSSKVSTPQRYNSNDRSRDVVKKRRSAVFLTEPYNVSSVSQHVPGTKNTENKPENIDVEELDNTDVEKNEESKNSEDIEDDQNTKKTRDNKEDDYVDYWDTKHHKVEQSILVDIDSLSYHQMALVRQESFVNGVQPRQPLLWSRSRSNSLSPDSPEKALSELSLRVNNMFTDITEAAKASINLGERTTDRGLSIERVTSVSPTNNIFNQLKSVEPACEVTGPPVLLPAITSRSQIKMAVINSPIAKMSLEKIYPRHSTNFSSFTPGRDTPASRIVDQQNLIEETKISSTLFKSKRNRLAKPKTVESHFRQLIVQDELTEANRDKMSMEEAVAEICPKKRLEKHERERLQDIVERSLISSIEEERFDAARSLGVLLCPETFVIDALKARSELDVSDRVKFSSCISLIQLGSLDEVVLNNVCRYLTESSRAMRMDLLDALAESRSIRFIDRDLDVYTRLCQTLKKLCSNDTGRKSRIAFKSAVCLSKLKVGNEFAITVLQNELKGSNDVHNSAQALDCLVQLQVLNEDTIKEMLKQLKSSSVWKHRKRAAQHFVKLGLLGHSVDKYLLEKIYHGLKLALWDEVNQEVRTEAAKALSSFNLLPRVCSETERDLQDNSEIVRAQAVICVGTLVMKNEHVLKILLNILQLDPSQVVQQKVIQTILVLGLTDDRFKRLLQAKSASDGRAARDASHALEILLKSSHPNTSTKKTSV